MLSYNLHPNTEPQETVLPMSLHSPRDTLRHSSADPDMPHEESHELKRALPLLDDRQQLYLNGMDNCSLHLRVAM